MKTIAVIGWKNSGKTTLVSNLVNHLSEKKFKVGVVKHAHHTFDIDYPNTDSYKIREAGSFKTTIVSEKRLAFIEEKNTSEIDIEELIPSFSRSIVWGRQPDLRKVRSAEAQAPF